jgi:hypothetical protein
MEWEAFLLAIACSTCDDNIEDFLNLFQSDLIKDLAFLLFGVFTAEEIVERSWLSTKTLEATEKLRRRLSKKCKENPTYWRNLKKDGVVALPFAEEAQTESS